MHNLVVRVVAVLRSSAVEPDIFVCLELATEEREGEERASPLTGNELSCRANFNGRYVFRGRATH
jgi:hypothetical protein